MEGKEASARPSSRPSSSARRSLLANLGKTIRRSKSLVSTHRGRQSSDDDGAGSDSQQRQGRRREEDSDSGLGTLGHGSGDFSQSSSSSTVHSRQQQPPAPPASPRSQHHIHPQAHRRLQLLPKWASLKSIFHGQQQRNISVREELLWSPGREGGEGGGGGGERGGHRQESSERAEHLASAERANNSPAKEDSIKSDGGGGGGPLLLPARRSRHHPHPETGKVSPAAPAEIIAVEAPKTLAEVVSPSSVGHLAMEPDYDDYYLAAQGNMPGFREYLFKVLLIGDPGVGKTSFVQRYTNNVFRSDYKGTVGVDFALKVLRLGNDCRVKLQLWDIAGQERFTWMTRVYYRGSRGCIVMLDLGERSSLSGAARWKRDLDDKCRLPDGSRLPCLLLANKCDLRERRVTLDEIEEFHRQHDFIGWTETSAKDDMMVKDSVKFLVDTMLKQEMADEEAVAGGGAAEGEEEVSGKLNTKDPEGVGGSRIRIQDDASTKNQQQPFCFC